MRRYFTNQPLAVAKHLGYAAARLGLMANLFELPRYIAIEGPIRVGKSTLAKIIAERMNAQRVSEPEDNPFLQAFYEGERGAAFQAQFAFLIQRYDQLRKLEAGPNSRKTIVADYIFE